MTVLRLPAAVALLAVAACGNLPPSAPAPAAGERLVTIPVRDETGVERRLIGRVCRPAGRGRAPVAVINHGAPPDPAAVALMQPTSCDSEPAQWFRARGYIVVFALRRGFGASEGPIAESSGSCDAPDYVRAGRESARDVAAIVRFATDLPDARPDDVVVIGQSTGGWATIAYDAAPHPGVTALISVAGGRGGHAFGAGGTYCRADRLVDAARVFGATATTPMLWVSAANDTFFEPALEQAMHDAFVAGGGRVDLVVTPAFDAEGHDLFYAPGGSALWGPSVARYLAARRRVGGVGS